MNIKTYLKAALEDQEILNLLADRKVYFLHAILPTYPYCEYEILDENGSNWAEGKEITTDFYVQVDIFSKGDYSAIETKVKEKMIANGFIRTSGTDLWEDTTKLYHKVLRFNTSGLAE